MPPVPLPVVFASEANAELLKKVLPARTVLVRNRRELFGATFTRGAVAFVDFDLIQSIEGGKLDAPIVAIMNVPAPQALAATVRALEEHPWLSHVVQAPMLAMDRARAHFQQLLERLTGGSERAQRGAAVGRTALINRASRRGERLARMREFFEKHGIGERIVTSLVDVAEELVMNGLYDAPKEAGFFSSARSRDEDVELPRERACEISYGVEGAVAFVRHRDTFGSLSRARVVEVLTRCTSGNVEIDGSRGGAGLGLYRVLSAASSVSITVVSGTLTDVMVSIGKNDSRRVARPLSVDLSFADQASACIDMNAAEDGFLADQSFSLVGFGNTPTPSPC